MAADQVPSLDNLGSVPQSLFSTAVAFLTLAWFSVLLRAYVRGVMIRSFGLDDWTILVAVVAFTVQCTYMIRMSEMEMNPERNNNLKGIAILVTDTIAFSGSYAITSVFLKISLGLFFLRIIIEPWQRMIIYVALVCSTTYGLVYFGLVAFGCGDPSEYLLRTIEGKCLSIKDVIIPASYAHTALNAAVDWLMALLPIFSLRKLNMPRVTKFWAYCLLALGAAGSIVSLIRFGYVEGLVPGHDFFKQSAKFALYSTVEPGLGIAAVSFATLRPLFRQCLESARSVSGTQRSGRRAASIVPDIQLQGLGSKAKAERQGFRAFGSGEEMPDNWTEITVQTDLEKGG